MAFVRLEEFAAIPAAFRLSVLQIKVIEERLVRRKAPETDVAPESRVLGSGRVRGMLVV
jgi:hypothetical protein